MIGNSLPSTSWVSTAPMPSKLKSVYIINGKSNLASLSPPAMIQSIILFKAYSHFSHQVTGPSILFSRLVIGLHFIEKSLTNIL